MIAKAFQKFNYTSLIVSSILLMGVSYYYTTLNITWSFFESKMYRFSPFRKLFLSLILVEGYASTSLLQLSPFPYTSRASSPPVAPQTRSRLPLQPRSRRLLDRRKKFQRGNVHARLPTTPILLSQPVRGIVLSHATHLRVLQIQTRGHRRPRTRHASRSGSRAPSAQETRVNCV